MTLKLNEENKKYLNQLNKNIGSSGKLCQLNKFYVLIKGEMFNKMENKNQEYLKNQEQNALAAKVKNHEVVIFRR